MTTQQSMAAKAEAPSIAERISQAIMEHRVAPGMKLAEERLALAFRVSRTKIRQALTVLAKEGLVQLHPNRGAYVTSPSVQEAQDLFAARRVVERDIVCNVVARAGKAGLRRLRQHLAKEARARADNDHRTLIKLTGEFHMLLAELGGNSFFIKLMGELCPLTCLIIALYNAPNAPACPDDEHSGIVDAIEAGDAATACARMLAHLDHVERELNLGPRDKGDVDWEAVFG
ncbi:GntR family transcriptional regulator [Cupriavidus necator]|uniref:GntR family transcriptional regulator n=1 Tax=Cupriavidus necator TaxID=106590 RepID=UPI0002FF1E96|nr:GntR family transcriptional regulator [Cupriavidus necator]WKA44903.1 GntR family transcriptional regulator [Cupriavidus necator]